MKGSAKIAKYDVLVKWRTYKKIVYSHHFSVKNGTTIKCKKYYYDEIRITIRRRMWSVNVYKKSRLSIIFRVICAFVWTNTKFKSVLNFTYLLLRLEFESWRIRSSVSVQDRGKVRFPLEYCKRENGQS